jgi:hypothetical protein
VWYKNGKPTTVAPGIGCGEISAGHSFAECNQRHYDGSLWRSASSITQMVDTKAFRVLRNEETSLLTFKTDKPNALLAAIKAAIDSKRITTWAYDTNGDFTHSPIQWANKAWMRPTVIAGTQLDFGVIRPRTSTISSEIYAIYHGRFVEMMLAHFDADFGSVSATAKAAVKDNVAA